MRTLIWLVCVITSLGCNAKTAPDEGRGENSVSSIRVCKGSPDTSCATFEENFGLASDCTYLYSKPGVAWKAVAPSRRALGS